MDSHLTQLWRGCRKSTGCRHQRITQTLKFWHCEVLDDLVYILILYAIYFQEKKNASQNQSQKIMCTFIISLVQCGLVHSTLPSNLSVCSIDSVLSELHGTRACGTQPSVSS